ncbi:MAG: class I SAM-dependent methyltransferase [Acidimicrobiales bacterium]
MPASDSDPDLDAAYSVETPDDNRRLYATWARSYDESFVQDRGYVYHQAVVAAFSQRHRPAGPLVDIGCGTGVVGVELCHHDTVIVDGIDLSLEMLEVAAAKTGTDAKPVYRNLIQADLTLPVDLGDGTYAGVLSAGTFTHGHLGPDPLDEVLRIAQPGGVLAIGVNADHFVASGFAEWFDRAVQGELITSFEIVRSGVYDSDVYAAADAEVHQNTMSSIAVFEKRV